MTRKKKVVVKDTDDIKNIFIQLNFKRGKTTVFSNFTPWENLAFLMEALGVTASMCIEKNMSKKEVYQAINDYLVKVLDDYHILMAKREEG